MGQKCCFCRRVKGVRLKKSTVWVQKVHFLGVLQPSRLSNIKEWKVRVKIISLKKSEISLFKSEFSLWKEWHFHSFRVIFVSLSKEWFWSHSSASDFSLCLLKLECIHLQKSDFRWLQCHSLESEIKIDWYGSEDEAAKTWTTRGARLILSITYTVNSSSKLLETPRLDAVITIRDQETRELRSRNIVTQKNWVLGYVFENFTILIGYKGIPLCPSIFQLIYRKILHFGPVSVNTQNLSQSFDHKGNTLQGPAARFWCSARLGRPGGGIRHGILWAKSSDKVYSMRRYPTTHLWITMLAKSALSNTKSTCVNRIINICKYIYR